ncbi:hypothetical protein BDV35DRAFT_377694 [Aspergillus flavus]|uniref:DNA, SC020 n=3 Tax=Aspergillus subgen. Circumdati TaxID=2720871 RepID=Q2U414_ASPOR|nr:unnamed protein product [Aspergillus oryzae RIB40]EIT76359.1 hypothetical protein Ao3042_07465 [Aspergillus oryzae 3.042]KAB8250139.1 hypothetical protein BDV35DRAFT_377694 [Aspergillus flavus]KDE85458.1 hypothetical protein AO1008_00971 [Aspergillus oryzae 100-8]BAE63701.1 unnamed protein product [Aspergillus oryzae RIB40]|eukprot:EIT76359.1 hypothetical protein Ao3042_07465 [Aspergillus oryzae 3.042]
MSHEIDNTRSKRMLLLLYLTAFLFFLGENIQQAPRTQIYETIICHRMLPWNSKDTPAREGCKSKAVQEELAFLKGTERLLGALPTVLVIPWSIFAERYGRCLSLKLALAGVLCEEAWSCLICWFSDLVPIRLILLAPLFEIIGGGPAIITTIVHLLAAEVTTPETRTSTFFVIRAMAIAAAILAQLVSSFLMTRNAWVPWLLGLLCILLAMFAVPYAPNPAIENSLNENTMLDPGQHNARSMGTLNQEESLSSKHATVRSRLALVAKQLQEGTKVVYGNFSLIVLLAMSFLGELCEDSLAMVLLLYISKRYSWEFAQANYLWALGEAVQFVFLIILLPRISTMLLARFRMNAYAADFTISIASTTMLSFGSLLLGIGVSIPVAIIGIPTFPSISRGYH